MGYVWNQYKQLYSVKDALGAERKAISEERVAFEKLRADTASAHSSRELELNTREIHAQQIEQQLKERSANVQRKTDENNAAAQTLRATGVALSQAARLRVAEENLQRLMSEFSAMGINLNNQPCGDAAAASRFNAAKSKYSEALALSEANGLYAKYRHFFFANGGTSFTFCPK
ncbi:MAG: hypothetical protein ABI865_14700 [Nitrosospira sp.]